MAGTTTLLPFNPNQTNQESDAAYLADSDRANGFPTGAIWPAILANKSLNQMSNYLYALFTAFAQKGFTTNDDNVPLLTAVCANFLTTADILPNIVSVASSPTPAFNAAASNGFQMTLTGNVTSSTISGLTPGQLIAFYFAQDGVGGRTVVFPTSFVGAIQPDPTASAVSLQMFRVDLAGVPRAVTPMMSNSDSGLAVFNAMSLAAPGTAGQVLTNVGGIFVPRNGVLPRIDNANGSYVTMPDGTLLQWGEKAASASGNDWTVAITFPTAFPNAVQSVQTTLLGLGSTGGKNKSCGVIGSPTLSGFNAGMAAMVYIGGSGTNFTGSEIVSWFATGY